MISIGATWDFSITLDVIRNKKKTIRCLFGIAMHKTTSTGTMLNCDGIFT